MTQIKRVGLVGATGIGLGAMLGAGVFSVWGPAAEIAGTYLLWAVVLAAIVATINALSTAQLAAYHPVAGGAYTFGRRELHDNAGFVAGFGFVVGKTASIAAIALALGFYLWPAQPAVVATAAIVAAWLLNVRGITRTATVAIVVAVVVVISLATFVAAGSAQAPTDWSGLWEAQTVGWGPLGQMAGAAAMIFFAFAGYARIATLGEEVRDPVRVIPRAIVVALVTVLVVYLGVAAALLHVVGADALAESSAPIADLVAGTWVPVAAVTVVAVIAAFGSLVALMAGVGRTAMAMARERDLPPALAAVGSRGVPWRAEGASALIAIALAWVGGLGFAIAMSSFAVLVYYGVANLAARRARQEGHVAGLRVWPGVSMVGAVACAALALSLPLAPAVVAGVVLVVAVSVRAWLRRS